MLPAACDQATSDFGDASNSLFPPSPAAQATRTTLPPPPALEQVARAERGHELLRTRQTDDAERIFQALAVNSHPEVALMGREGLAEVMLARGDLQLALKAANDIIARAPTDFRCDCYLDNSTTGTSSCAACRRPTRRSSPRRCSRSGWARRRSS